MVGQEPQGGTGHHPGHNSSTLHLLLHAGFWNFPLQAESDHPLDHLPHAQHHPHGDQLHLLDILLILHRLALGHRVPRGGWPGVGPVDCHVEGGLPLLHLHQGHRQGVAGQHENASRV